MPSYAAGPSTSIGMPVGGPPEGGSVFSGRLPPKAKKTRKKSEENEAGLDGRDGGEDGAGGDDLDASGKRRKRQRAGPGGDSLTCHQVSAVQDGSKRSVDQWRVARTDDHPPTLCSVEATTNLAFGAPRSSQTRRVTRSSASLSTATETSSPATAWIPMRSGMRAHRARRRSARNSTRLTQSTSGHARAARTRASARSVASGTDSSRSTTCP